MSRAFVKEPDGGEAFEELPDRPLSPHPNIVTPDGLALIETTLTRLHQDYAAAQAAGDRAALARAARDLRYWTSRRMSAQVAPPPADTAQVQFGSTVTVARGGRRQTFRIVGEDEADPARGTLSYVSPLARALMGKALGDILEVGGAEVEIVAIT
jgi:transcription elongation GreA/GreB family factor